MNTTAPHYLLFTEAKDLETARVSGGRWRFVLEQIGTTTRFEEADSEPGVWGERLQLLAVVRGLEALERKSHVTLITSSKYVGRGIRRGLTQWRQNDWQWEHFGKMALIKNHDLWKRIDGAMQIHNINCRVWQFDPPHVRTQVLNETDQAELIGISSPDSQSFADELEVVANQDKIQTSLGRGSHLTLNLNKSRRAVEQTLDQVSRVADALADKVKPIGQGKAFGYAMN